jgi:glucose/arabinose dehydrogenase
MQRNRARPGTAAARCKQLAKTVPFMLARRSQESAMLRLAMLLSVLPLALAAQHGESSLPPSEAHAVTAPRVTWTKSRVVGRPDPPPPYRARTVFPELKLRNPLYIATIPGSNTLLVVEQRGRILAVANGATGAAATTFAQLPDCETYSVCFHPDFAKNRYVYLFTNGPQSKKPRKNRILRFQVEAGPAPKLDPKSEKLIIDWDSDGHNGGEMAFGPDGMLYISSGDGTTDSDTRLTGQDLSDLASGIIRIDVDRPAAGKSYAVPMDNPFLNVPKACPELWAYGFRNPWRLTFHPGTGDLLVGDIGQDLWELIHLVKKGGNYGWSVFEGSHPFYPTRARGPHPILKPLVEHPHSEARSITGGFVYTGAKHKDLKDVYLYGDYSTGKVWGLRLADGRVTWHKELADTRAQILGFGQGPAGEIYLVDYAGKIAELEPAPPEPVRGDFPRKLSETGIFEDTAKHRVMPGLIPYSVNSPLWSDGAEKERFIGLPGDTRMTFRVNNAWGLPEQTVLVKTFSLEMEAGKPATQRRIETRLLTLQGGEWIGYSYRWNEAQTDADLVGAPGEDRPYTIRDGAGDRLQVWRFPSRTECMVCHSRAAEFVLGVNTAQMNRNHGYATGVENQLAYLTRVGVLEVGFEEHRQWLDRGGVKRWSDAAAVPVSLRAVGIGHGSTLPAAVQMLHGAVGHAWPQLRKSLEAELKKLPDIGRRLAGPPSHYPALPDPADRGQSLERRARSYLHANCAQCHVLAGGGNSFIDLHFKTDLADTKLIDVKPGHDAFGLPEAMIVRRGKPDSSVLYHRVTKLGTGRMPPLSSGVVDPLARELLAEWIREMR